MELFEMKSMWQAYDTKLEKTLKLNLHCLELIQTQKVKSKLAPLLWQRIVEIAFHAIAIVLLLAFLTKNISGLPYIVSAVSLLIFYVIAVAMCLKQISIIKRMDYSNDIIHIQSSLVILQTHIVNYMRLAVLCIPGFLAYPTVVSKVVQDFNLTSLSFLDISTGYHGNWFNLQVLLSCILFPLCIWFYREVRYKNIQKKWVKRVIQKTSGTRVAKAFEFIKELEALKKDAV